MKRIYLVVSNEGVWMLKKRFVLCLLIFILVLSIFVIAENSPPVITSEPDTLEINEGKTYSYIVSVSDVDWNIPTFLPIQGADWLGWGVYLNSFERMLNGTAPLVTQDTNYPVIITISDGNGGEVSQDFTITVKNIELNCTDGIDDDSDGLTDCMDTDDCCGSDFCGPEDNPACSCTEGDEDYNACGTDEGVCIKGEQKLVCNISTGYFDFEGVCENTFGPFDEVCNNFLDDDCDGFTDCEDLDSCSDSEDCSIDFNTTCPPCDDLGFPGAAQIACCNSVPGCTALTIDDNFSSCECEPSGCANVQFGIGAWNWENARIHACTQTSATFEDGSVVFPCTFTFGSDFTSNGDFCEFNDLILNGECVPDCTDKECGDDGCGSMCAVCVDEQQCNATFQCESKPASELDTDNDGVMADVDNCNGYYNPDQNNTDEDLRGDACDNCILIDNDDQADFDGDCGLNAADQNNCGDLCDDDDDNDGVLDVDDACPFDFNVNCLPSLSIDVYSLMQKLESALIDYDPLNPNKPALLYSMAFAFKDYFFVPDLGEKNLSYYPQSDIYTGALEEIVVMTNLGNNTGEIKFIKAAKTANLVWKTVVNG